MERVTGLRHKPGPVHYPYVRALQLEWQELPTGFRARSNDPYRFEVICAACGDIDGPLEYQPYAVQQLRGPYEAKRLAEKVAQRHHVGSTFGQGKRGGSKRDQMKYLLPLRSSQDRSDYVRQSAGASSGAPRDGSTSWHQVLWVRLQAGWIRWKK